MKCLIIVDAQYDFMPGGSLAVKDGDQIVPVINKLITKFDLIIFTQDWHPEGMEAFASSHEGKKPFDQYVNSLGETDTLWPDHCVRDTRGAMIHEGIKLSEITGDFYFFKKGMEKDKHPYSGFGAEELKEFLDERGVTNVFIVGLALDYCVKDTAIDSAMAGFDTVVIEDGTKPIDPNIGKVLEDFNDAGIKIIDSWELNMYNLL